MVFAIPFAIQKYEVWGGCTGFASMCVHMHIKLKTLSALDIPLYKTMFWNPFHLT